MVGKPLPSAGRATLSISVLTMDISTCMWGRARSLADADTFFGKGTNHQTTSHNIAARAPPIQRWPAAFQCLPPEIRPHHPGAPGEWNGSTGLRGVPGTAELPMARHDGLVATPQRWVLAKKQIQTETNFNSHSIYYSKIFKGYFGRQDSRCTTYWCAIILTMRTLSSDSKHWSSGAFKKFIETSAKPKLSSRIGPWLPQIDT